MSIVYWKLGHVVPQGISHPLEAFVKFRDGMVYDVDSRGWDEGIRSGDRLAEMKWRYPQATWIPWQTGDYHKTLLLLQEWLRIHAISYRQDDPRYGWWEWPDMNLSDWTRLVSEIVPRWAKRVQAGIANHPWMAHWIAQAGPSLPVDSWKTDFSQAYVLNDELEANLWPQMPLSYVEGISGVTRQLWNKRRWERVQDVPGLLERIRQQPAERGGQSSAERTTLVRRVDDSVRSGVGEILRDMAEELQQHCRLRNQGVRRIDLYWIGESGLERREREWPQALGDGKSVMVRVMSLLNHPPSRPFDEVRIEVVWGAVPIDQLGWWDHPLRHPHRLADVDQVRLLPTRREQMLGHWDLLRMGHGRL